MTVRHAAILLIPALLAGCASVPSDRSLELAITIDDLPLHGPLPTGDNPQRVAAELVSGLRAGGASQVHGFVNGHWTESDPTITQVLRAWTSAGLPVGNHGWAHRNLDDLSSAEFEQELRSNEPILQQLASPREWRWFRYPFLAEGSDPAKREAARSVLARHGYRIAAVTMDFSDWQWTAPYARCRNKNDAASIAKLEQAYLDAARAAVGHSRGLSRQVHGRDIPYVLLLHGGAFTARMLPRLLALYRTEGFRFVSLDQAERDVAYAADVDPSRPAGPASLEAQAAARNIPVPPRPSQAFLEQACA